MIDNLDTNMRMVMWLKSSEYRTAIRPHLDADGKIIA